MNAPKFISDELYQILTQHAARDEKWAAYFLLFNACYEILKQAPQTQQACEQTNIEMLLVQSLEHLGKTIEEVLPGGAEEFDEYMPISTERYRKRNRQLSRERA